MTRNMSASYGASVTAERDAASICGKCKAPLARSNARGKRENMAFVFGGEVLRCLLCDTRYIRCQNFTFSGHSNPDEDADFRFAWRVIAAGFVMCFGIAVWTLHKFHRWPF